LNPVLIYNKPFISNMLQRVYVSVNTEKTSRNLFAAEWNRGRRVELSGDANAHYEKLPCVLA
jgi:hypothetical protein